MKKNVKSWCDSYHITKKWKCNNWIESAKKESVTILKNGGSTYFSHTNFIHEHYFTKIRHKNYFYQSIKLYLNKDWDKNKRIIFINLSNYIFFGVNEQLKTMM